MSFIHRTLAAFLAGVALAGAGACVVAAPTVSTAGTGAVQVVDGPSAGKNVFDWQ